MSKQKAKWARELCVYCLKNPGQTEDHVIPKSLFRKPYPAGMMVKVPACKSCNQAKAKNDAYLRDMLAIDFRTARHPIAQDLLAGPVRRSVERKQSVVIRAAVEANLPPEPLYTPSGLYMGHYVPFPLDGDRLKQIFFTIVRGLYYHIHKQRLPLDCRFEGGYPTAEGAKEMFEWFLQRGAQPVVMGENVFGCMYIYAEEVPTRTTWLMWFYNSIAYYVETWPAPDDPTNAA